MLIDEVTDREDTVFIVPEKLSGQVDVSNLEIVDDVLDEEALHGLVNKY